MAGAPDVSLGPPYDTRLIVQDLGLFLKVRENHPIVEVGVFVHGFSVVLTNRWWRTFGATATLFGEGIRFDLDLDLAWIEGRGVVLNLSAGLDVTFNVEWTPLGDRNPNKASFDYDPQHPPRRAPPGDPGLDRRPRRDPVPRLAADRPRCHSGRRAGRLGGLARTFVVLDVGHMGVAHEARIYSLRRMHAKVAAAGVAVALAAGAAVAAIGLRGGEAAAAAPEVNLPVGTQWHLEPRATRATRSARPRSSSSSASGSRPGSARLRPRSRASAAWWHRRRADTDALRER